MDIQTRYATEADGKALGKVHVQSFRYRGFLEDMFPDTPDGVIEKYKTMRALEFFSDPQIHILTAEDVSNNEVVGYARWLIPTNITSVDCKLSELSEKTTKLFDEPEKWTPKTMNQQVVDAFKKILVEKKKEHATDDDIVLELLGTLPIHQGKGAGSKLLNWGTSIADTANRRIYLEATAAGYPLYLKNGWKVLEELTIDLSHVGGCSQPKKFILMMREPQPVRN